MENNSFKMGLRDGLPICLGYLSVSFAFGIFAVQSGLYIWQAVLVSMFNVTSAGQLAAVPIIASAGSFIELALTQLIINARYSLMSVSLSQRLGKRVSVLDRFIFAFVNTDEVFAVAGGKRTTLGRRYMYGLIILPFVGWTLGTFVGAVAGEVLPELIISALGIAIYAMFIAIVTPDAVRAKSTGACVIFSIALSCIFRFVPYINRIPEGFAIIICTLIASITLAIVAPIDDDEKSEDAEESTSADSDGDERREESNG